MITKQIAACILVLHIVMLPAAGWRAVKDPAVPDGIDLAVGAMVLVLSACVFVLWPGRDG